MDGGIGYQTVIHHKFSIQKGEEGEFSPNDMSSNREKLMKLLDDRSELLPLVHDILAEHHLSEIAYDQSF